MKLKMHFSRNNTWILYPFPMPSHIHCIMVNHRGSNFYCLSLSILFTYMCRIIIEKAQPLPSPGAHAHLIPGYIGGSNSLPTAARVQVHK